MARISLAQARARGRTELARLFAILASAQNEDGTEFSLPVVDYKPTATDVLNGVVTTAGAIITVPAGRTWRGSVTVVGNLAAPAGSAALNALPFIKVNGTGAVPTPNVVVAMVPLGTPAIPAGTTGLALAGTVTIPNLVVIAPAGNAVTVDFDANGATNSRGIAIGQLL